MPKVIQENEYAPLLAVMTVAEAALSVDQIGQRLGGRIARRTLQRRLAELVTRGKLVPEGEKRGRRYRMKPEVEHSPVMVVEEDRVSPPPPDSAIPLSESAREIRAQVMRPMAQRRPVGYNPEFLRDYQPNVTRYLLPDHRGKLMGLGEVSAGKGQPAGTLLRQVMDRLLIDLSWNSSRLEGNTYSLLETQRLLAMGEGAPGKQAVEAQMILNHKAAIELLAEQANEIGFNRYTLCNLHALLAEGLLPHAHGAGRLRDCAVAISGSVFHPLEGPQLLDEHFALFLRKAEAIEDAFEQAFFAMVHLPYLQPFEDVNKRVSRLAANIPLVRHNLAPLSFVDVPQDDYVHAILGVYELNRIDYLRDVFVWAYERSCNRYGAVRQVLGEPDPLRMKYRAQLGRLVGGVVREQKNKQVAASWIAAQATREVVMADRARFVELVETELTTLHEGNIARFRLRPSEYYAWKAKWE